MVWGNTPKLSWNFFDVLGKDLNFFINFLDALEKGLKLTLKMFLMDSKRSQANLKVEIFSCMHAIANFAKSPSMSNGESSQAKILVVYGSIY
jgi:hypothetical protein